MSFDLDKRSWRQVAFGDVVRNVNSTIGDPESDGIDRVIGMEHLDPGELRIERWGTLGDGATFSRRVRPGQTLFGKRRAYQRKVAYADFDAVCSGDILTLEPLDDQLSAEFLPFVVQSEPFFDHALGTSAGSLSPRTNWSSLADFTFDLPPVPEQDRIAKLLISVDEARRSAKGVANAIAAARDAWADEEIERLSVAAQVPFANVWARSPESGWSAVPVDQPTGFYVLSLAALNADGYRPGSVKNVADTPQSRAVRLRQGDLLVSRANTIQAVGRAGIFSENRSDVSFPDTMMRISLREDVLPEFALAVLRSAGARSHMRRSAAGSATSMVKINRASLGRLPFPNVSVAQQEAVVDQLHLLEESMAAAVLNQQATCALRAALMAAILGRVE